MSGHGTPPADGWSLTLPPGLWAELSGHLFTDGGRHGAVILADRTVGPRGPRLLARELILAEHDVDHVQGSTDRYQSLTAEFVRDAVARARDRRLIYLAVHSSRQASFSDIELASHERGYPALRRITGRPVGAVVLTRSAAAGDLWLTGGTRAELVEIVVAGDPLLRLPSRTADPPLSADPRLVMGRLQVGVVGLCGAGSLLVELLARRALGGFVLIDTGDTTEAELPCLVGATRADLGTQRTRFAARAIARASPGTAVSEIRAAAASPVSRRALAGCDWIFLTGGGHEARLAVNDLVHRYLIPATQVGATQLGAAQTGRVAPAGGRVVSRFLPPGLGCLWCTGLIEPGQLAGHLRGDGAAGNVDALQATAAAVAAAMAVDHFAHAVAGPFSGDHAADGRARPLVPERLAGCPACDVGARRADDLP